MTELLHTADESLLRRLLLSPLVPLEGLFGAAAALRRSHWRDKQQRAPIPVISVGNLAVGGAGKTPITLVVAQRLLARGRKVAILSRGYGGRGSGARFVSREGTLLLDAADAGDEPVLMARRLPEVQVLVGPRRVELARLAAEAGADVALLDDGFQHLQLARDLDIVVLDGASPFGNGRLLPRGPLREKPEALSRAGLGWISKVDEGDPKTVELVAEEILRRTGREAMRSRYVPTELLSPDLRSARDLAALEGLPVLLLAGIARPGSFRRTLERIGAKVVGESLFADHHAFDARELDAVFARARAAGAALVVCTEKDAIRLPPLPADAPIAALRVDTEIVSGSERLDEALDRALGGSRA